MSAKIATKSVATNLSEKFAKELNKFFGWAKDTGYEITKSGNNHEWSLKLLSGFEEPGRNKMDAYIKGLMKKYVISKDDEDIDDYKVILKDFKDNKPKRKRAETSTEGESDNTVVIDNNLDTSETYFLDTLDFDTNTLLKKFGKPVKNETAKNRFEWKVKVGDNVYSIYDWVNDEGEFDPFADTWWHIGGVKNNKKDIKTITNFLKVNQVKKQKQSASKKRQEETDEELEKEIEETEGETSDQENLEDILQEDTKATTEDLFGEISDIEDDLDLDTVDDE
jgi:hypothetical protein